MRISDWSSDVCSSDLRRSACCREHAMKRLIAIALLLLPMLGIAAEPVGLDALLKQVQDAAGQDARLNQQREQRFLRDKNQQAPLVDKWEAQLAFAKSKAAPVRARLAANHKTIAESKRKRVE